MDIDLVNEPRDWSLTYLLDINVLIALFDASHLNHESARARWKTRSKIDCGAAAILD